MLFVLLQAPGAFPDSAQAAQPDQPSSHGEIGSGKQLETTRTAVPVEVEKSNAAAASPPATMDSMQKCTGEQTEPTGSAVPPEVQNLDAAASQVMHMPHVILLFVNGDKCGITGDADLRPRA